MWICAPSAPGSVWPPLPSQSLHPASLLLLYLLLLYLLLSLSPCAQPGLRDRRHTQSKDGRIHEPNVTDNDGHHDEQKKKRRKGWNMNWKKREVHAGGRLSLAIFSAHWEIASLSLVLFRCRSVWWRKDCFCSGWQDEEEWTCEEECMTRSIRMLLVRAWTCGCDSCMNW